MKIKKDVNGRPLGLEKGLYMDGYLWQNAQTLHQRVEKKWDSVGLIVGYSGDGKSELAMQFGLSLDSTLRLHRVVFTAEQFEEAVDKATVGQVVIWDEADDLADNWNTVVLQVLKKKMKRIRQQRLHIVWVTPTFFDLNKYFVIDRTMYLIHVYAKGLERGFFRFFTRAGKKKLYLQGKREWDMTAAKPVFYGRFTKAPKDFPIDLSDGGAYQEKKRQASQELLGRPKSPKAAVVAYRKKCAFRLKALLTEKKGVKVTQAELGRVFGVDRSTISHDMAESEGEGPV